MDKLKQFLNILEDEMVSSRLLPKDKEIKFEYYTTEDDDGNKYINNVEITIENQRESFRVPTLKPSGGSPIQKMAYYGFYIVKELNLHKIKKGPADIVVRGGNIVSISGYTLKNQYSIYQVDRAFVNDLKKDGIIEEIMKNMIVEK